MFKPHPLEFFQTELDAMAAEVGKLATEVEFVVTEEVVDGVAGHSIAIKAAEPAPAVVPESVAPVTEPVAEPAAVAETPAEPTSV